MLWGDVLNSIPLMIAANTATVIALAAWRRREAPSAHYFALLMLAVAQWSIWSALALGTSNSASALLCTQIGYLGIAVVPVTWVAFAISYTGRHSLLTRRTLFLVSIIPMITTLVVWTNDTHHLMWREFAVNAAGRIVALRGPWYWVHSLYSYTLLLIGTLMLCEMLLRSARIYREQGIALVLGAVIPLFANTLQLADIKGAAGDLTPLGFAISGILLLWGVYRFRLFEMLPVAHEIVLRDLRDGIIVLDAQDRVCDINLAAQSVLNVTERDAVGRPIDQVLAHQPALGSEFLASHIDQAAEDSGLLCQIEPPDGGSSRYYDVHVHPLEGQTGAAISRAVTLRDVTERRLAEEERQKLIAQLEEALQNVRTLKGLLPICTNCKKIRDDAGYWTEVESYITSHSEADFTHGLCPDCIKSLYPDLPPDEEESIDEIWDAS